MPSSRPSATDVDTTFQVVPFQRSTRGDPPPPPESPPTAQALRADDAATANRPVPSLPSGLFGLGTRVHVLPFQCRITVTAPVPEPVEPTTQAFAAEVAVTARRKKKSRL